MIVIGDRKSSNTTRLAELCRAHCPLVYHISRAEELDPRKVSGVASVGITAGASTPGWIIKEVKDKMSEENINAMEIEESFADMLEKSIKTLNTGDKVTGVVTGITATEVNVDLGTKHAGYIPLSELSDDPSVKPEDIVKVGDEIETYVMRVNDVEGVATLSKKRLDSVKNWDTIEAAVEEKTILEGTVTEVNKGGIVVNVKGIRVFVPASQTGKPRGADLSEMVKEQVKLRITEVNRSRRRVVGSIRSVLAEERAAKAAEVWANIEEGKHYEGTVKSLTSYGAFVDIGGVDGMVHVSELSWSRIKNPAEVVSVGDKVNVYVISFDAEKKKISLGMKDRNEDPWEKFTSTYEVGSVASVRVVKLMTFGAFAEIVPGVDGLIHISQIADHRIEKPGDELEEGQIVDVKITDIDYDRKKVSLSIRALLNDNRAAAEDDGEEDEVPARGFRQIRTQRGTAAAGQFPFFDTNPLGMKGASALTQIPRMEDVFMATITKDTIVGDILDIAPETAPAFIDIGMHCLGCPASRNETVEQACLVHDQPVEELVEKLNAIIAANRK